MEQYEKYLGATLDSRYRIEGVVGIGGMAVVFKAFDMLMNRTVAIKMLKNEIANDEEAVKRFINESKAVAMMSHPNIVSIYDVSVREDIKYIVMEFIEGITLKNYMNKRGILSLRETISYTEQILRALQHSHSKGIIHRDIKPQNIMLLKNGLVKVTDFGIAKLPNAETVTMTDKAIGTVYYISPEQASGIQIDTRSDIYSLGILMYEMTTGQLPFMADSPVSVAMMQINDEAKPAIEVNPEMPRGLSQIIGIAMEKNRDDRYQNAETMLRQLHCLKENPDIVFKIPKKKPSEEEDVNPLAALFGGGPLFPIIAGVALAFLILFSVSGVYVFNRLMTASTQTDTETITVPSFVGAPYDEKLSKWFADSDIYKVNITYDYNSEYEPGMILAQDPQPDSKRKVKAGEQFCEITLTISHSLEEVAVPDLTGLDQREAKLKLKAVGLVIKVEEKPSDIVSRGQVISTSPKKGETAKSGDTVIVYISSGVEEGDIEVPNFVGMTEQKAYLKIMELDLLPGVIIYVKDNAPAGTVLSQIQAKDSKVVEKTKIDLTISGGPKYDPEADDPFNPVTTTEAPETTTEPVDTTTEAPTETLPADDTTTAPEGETETTAPEETTGEMPPEETTAPEETTGADEAPTEP